MTPIITNILTNISKKLDALIDSNNNNQSYMEFNSSNCFTCESNDLSITYTKKHKKGYSYRIAVCNECGSSNKQVIMTIEGTTNPNLIVLSGWKKRAFFKPITLYEIDGKIIISEKFLSKVKQEVIDKELHSLKQKEKESMLASITEGAGHDLILEEWQKCFDNGLFDNAKKSIDPVNIRFTHKFPINSEPTKGFKILFPTAVLKSDPIMVFINSTVHWSISNKDGLFINKYNIIFNKAAIKTK